MRNIEGVLEEITARIGEYDTAPNFKAASGALGNADVLSVRPSARPPKSLTPTEGESVRLTDGSTFVTNPVALNETTHAVRYVESAAQRLTTDIVELEAGSKLTLSVGYIQNRLSDAHDSLVAAEQEIQRLIHEVNFR